MKLEHILTPLEAVLVRVSAENGVVALREEDAVCIAEMIVQAEMQLGMLDEPQRVTYAGKLRRLRDRAMAVGVRWRPAGAFAESMPPAG